MIFLDSLLTFLINVVGKDLPFKGFKSKYQPYNKADKTGNSVTVHDAPTIIKYLKAVSDKMPHIKQIVIDDAQYIMAFEFMASAKTKVMKSMLPWQRTSLMSLRPLKNSGMI